MAKTGHFALTILSCLAWLHEPGRALGDSLSMPLNGVQLVQQLGTKAQCAANLSRILMAAHTWAMDNADQAPSSLQALTNELASPALLFCPANFRESVPTNWADVDWAKVDYTWDPSADWHDPQVVVCTCRFHENAGRVEGSVVQGGFRPGWPLITAGPKYVLTTPGEDVRVELRVSSNAFQPQLFQWRREHLEYVTNVEKVINPDFPQQVSWVTNVIQHAVGTNMPGQTNVTLVLTNIQIADGGLYRVTVSNQAGVSSSRSWLRVGPEYAGLSTNDSGTLVYCVNNLKMLSLLFRSWAADHGDQLPQIWDVLTNSDGSLMFGWPESLYCLSDKERTAPPEWSGVDLNNTSYELLSANAGSPCAPYCRCRAHGFYFEAGGDVVSRPSLKSVVPQANGTVQLTYKVFADRTNMLEASSDLRNWTALKTHSPTNGEFEFVDADKLQQRFYRLKLP